MKQPEAKGSRLERRARELLEARGYFCMRAGGPGLFDLVAFSRRGCRLIQVKSNRRAALGELAALIAFKNMPPNVTREIWIYCDRDREPEIHLVD